MADENPGRTVYEGKCLRMKQAGNWEYVERTRASGVVVILPLTRDGKIILVEQFRTAVGRNVIELPAGLAGDGEKKEELLEAAKRELLEETGYSTSSWTLLAEGPASAGLTNELITFFLASDVTPSAKTDPDSEEKIEAHEVSLHELPGWLEEKKKAGRLIDYKIFAALYLAR
jgi:ADP-ribose pyrophosphatase